MSKRRHNFGTKRFKEKSLFIFHARIALKSLILLFVRLIARGARIGKTHTHTHTHTHRQTDRQDKYCNPRACAPRVKDRTSTVTLAHARRGLIMLAVHILSCSCLHKVWFALLVCFRGSHACHAHSILRLSP